MHPPIFPSSHQWFSIRHMKRTESAFIIYWTVIQKWTLTAYKDIRSKIISFQRHLLQLLFSFLLSFVQLQTEVVLNNCLWSLDCWNLIAVVEPRYLLTKAPHWMLIALDHASVLFSWSLKNSNITSSWCLFLDFPPSLLDAWLERC
jgi:hypothetical protein